MMNDPSQHHHYKRISKVLNHLAEHWQSQPSLERLSDIAALSPDHFQRVFQQWVGVSPKQLIAILTHEQASLALKSGKSLLDIALDNGLSGPSRLHDLFIKIETMTPGTYKNQAAGIVFSYDFVITCFGKALFIVHDKGLAGLVFLDEESHEQDALDEMKNRWPRSKMVHNPAAILPYHKAIFENEPTQLQPLSLFLKGTAFQIQVWQALMAIPPASLTNYGTIANALGHNGARAVGGAVGNNPISWLIPCHRVLASDGLLNGYRWGLPRKYAMLAYETVGKGLQLRTANQSS